METGSASCLWMKNLGQKVMLKHLQEEKEMARTEKVKVIVYGVGAMGRMTANLMLEKGYEIVAAIDKYAHVGEDFGDVLGLDHKLGFTVSDDPDVVLSSTKADIVSICAKSLLKDMEPIFAQCLSYGFNVVSLAEETFWPWRIQPEASARLDKLAKDHGVTLTSCGIQDVVWLNAFCTLSACCHKMDKVIGRAVADQSPYGIEATKGIGFGLTVEEFNARTDLGEADPNWFGMTLEAIISRLQMTPTSIKDILEPVVVDHDVYYPGGDMTIPAGRVAGWNQITEIETAEGTTFRCEFISKICEKEGEEFHGWEIQGQPNMKQVIPGLEPPFIICSSIVNRIPDVINAAPGLVSLDKMPSPMYRSQLPETYINE